MARTEVGNGPSAPAPSAVVVSGSAYVAHADGQVLLIQHADSGRWALPGGFLELGERLTDTVARVTLEETGVDILVTGVIGVYSDSHRVRTCRDGRVRQQFSVCFRAHPLGGEPRPGGGSRDARWFEPGAVARLKIHPEMLLRIGHGLTNRPSPYLS